MTGAARCLAFRQTQDDAGDATLDEQQVDGDLTKPPLVICPRRQVDVSRSGDEGQEPRAPECRRLPDEPQRLAHPLGPVGRFVGHDKGHEGLDIDRGRKVASSPPLVV